MRTRVWIEQEIEVEVSAVDAVAAICDMETPERLPMALHGINHCAIFFQRIPDTLIAEMNDKQRDIIASALEEQAARYKTPNV